MAAAAAWSGHGSRWWRGWRLLAGSLIWCTERNGGLTTSIVGVLKGVVAVALGLVFMADGNRVTVLNLSGIAMVLLGGSWYPSLQCHRPRPAADR